MNARGLEALRTVVPSLVAGALLTVHLPASASPSHALTNAESVTATSSASDVRASRRDFASKAELRSASPDVLDEPPSPDLGATKYPPMECGSRPEYTPSTRFYVALVEPFTRWEFPQITWCYDNSDEPHGPPQSIGPTTFIREAFEAWAGVSALEFNEKSLRQCALVPDSEKIVISWSRAIPANILGTAHSLMQTSGARTRRVGYPVLERVRIELNREVLGGYRTSRSASEWRNAFLRTMLHEIGHAVGLAHSDQHGSIMFVSPPLPWTTLGQDDMEAVVALYGPSQAQSGTSTQGRQRRQLSPTIESHVDVQLDLHPSEIPADSEDGEPVWIEMHFRLGAVNSFGFRIVEPTGLLRLERSVEMPFPGHVCNSANRCAATLYVANSDALVHLPQGTRVEVFADGADMAAVELPSQSASNEFPFSNARILAQPSTARVGEPVLIEAVIDPVSGQAGALATLHVPGRNWQRFSVTQQGLRLPHEVRFQEPGIKELFLTLSDGLPNNRTTEDLEPVWEGARRVVRKVVEVIEE